MQTKLTLRLEEELIRKAKRFSKKSGKPVSRLVAEFFVTLDAPPPEEISEITPKVAALKGILKGTDVREKDYRRHLEERNLIAHDSEKSERRGGRQ
jgi:hypothetical protein